MEPRPRPLLGATLGLLLGLVIAVLIWQLGWIDPSRLVLFLVVAVTTLAVAALLTRSVSAARGRFVTVAVLAGILAGVALTGIPEQIRGGSISDGCTLQAAVGDAIVTPADTTAFDPLVVAADQVIPWTATSDTAIAVTQRVAGIRVGGFAIPINTVTVEGATEVQEIAGEVDVAAALAWVKDRSGLEISGIYHGFGTISGDAGECALDGYVKLAPATVYETNVLKGLWVALGVVLILIAWAALVVRKSFTDAVDARREADRVYSGTVTTGGAATGAATGYVAGDAEHSGATSPEAVAEPDDAPVASPVEPSDAGEEAPADADEGADAEPQDHEDEDEGADAEPQEEDDGADADDGDARIGADDEGPEPASEDGDSGPRP